MAPGCIWTANAFIDAVARLGDQGVQQLTEEEQAVLDEKATAGQMHRTAELWHEREVLAAELEVCTGRPACSPGLDRTAAVRDRIPREQSLAECKTCDVVLSCASATVAGRPCRPRTESSVFANRPSAHPEAFWHLSTISVVHMLLRIGC